MRMLILKKHVFSVPYDAEGMPKLGTWKEAEAQALEDAKKIAAGYGEPSCERCS